MTQSARVRLVGYLRVSTEEQAREGVSLDAQQARLGAYAEAYDAELVALDRDEGVSGKVRPEKRLGLAKALHRLRSGEADGLLVLKLDRLSRRTRDVLDLVDESRRQGFRLVSVSEQLDTGTAAGRMVVTVLAALAEMEREQAGERTVEGLNQVAREGRVRSHRTPFGWRTPSGSDRSAKGARECLVADPTEQRLLARILELEAAGAGDHRIAKSLNSAQVPNPRTGRPWTRGTIASIRRTSRRRQALVRHPVSLRGPSGGVLPAPVMQGAARDCTGMHP